MKKLSLAILLLTGALTSAQEILTLEAAYRLSEENYPLANQLSLLEEKNARELEILHKEYLPRIDLNAKATYQSDITEIPLDLGEQRIETVDKDQYRATLDVEQLIFNGGRTDARKELKTLEIRSQQQEVRVSLYQIKKRINHYFFGILQLREQLSLLDSKKEALSERIREVESQVKNGTALPASENILYAELLKIGQQQDEVRSQHLSFLKSLSAYVATPLDPSTVLELPEEEKYLTGAGARPETLLFSLKQEELEQQQNLLSKNLYPNIYGFAQGGYGRPGYNMLDNSFQDFYMVGVRLNWNVFDWGKIREQKRSVEISKDLIASEEETFNFNNNLELEEAEMKLIAIRKLLEKDREIIALREQILESTQSQLTHGVITPSEFLIEFNNLFEAKINRQLHEIELEMAWADYQIIKGNTEK